MMTNPSEQPVPSSIIAMSEHTQRVGQLVYDILPNDCEKIEFTARIVVGWGQRNALVYRGGSPFTFTGFDPKIIEAFIPLRFSMYKPDGGTWYTAVITVTNAGKADFQFDYEHEPAWTTPLDPAYYAADQDRYPRSIDNQPAWLRERLAEAGDRRPID